MSSSSSALLLFPHNPASSMSTPIPPLKEPNLPFPRLAPIIPPIQHQERQANARMEAFPPFTEDEKRFVLAEAIKTTRVPLQRLLALMNEHGAQPNWPDMFLPVGRNMNSCLAMYDQLQYHASLSQAPAYSYSPRLPESSSAKRKSGSETFDSPYGPPSAKRRESGIESATEERRMSGIDSSIQSRIIQPRPATAGSPRSYSPLTSSGSVPKKRGRPSKADIEARNAEAIARGHQLPLSKPSAPRKKKETGGDPRKQGPETPVQMAPMGQMMPGSVGQPSPRTLAPSLPSLEESMAANYARGAGGFTPVMASRPQLETSGAKIEEFATSEASSASKKRSRPATDLNAAGSGFATQIVPSQFVRYEPSSSLQPSPSGAPVTGQAGGNMVSPISLHSPLRVVEDPSARSPASPVARSVPDPGSAQQEHARSDI